MYKQRLHAFIIFCILLILICVARLAFLQVAKKEHYRKEIAQMGILAPRHLPTVRGTIYDRNSKVLAIDRPSFYISINYQLSRLLDDRVWQGNIELRSDEDTTREEAEMQLRDIWADKYQILMELIDKASEITDTDRDILDMEIRKINDDIWRLRKYITQLNKNIDESQVRLKDILGTNLIEMNQYYPLVELKDDSQLLEAQMFFAGKFGIEISSKPKRQYPYKSRAAHIIGWVTPVEAGSTDRFSEDEYKGYLAGEVAGLRGIEKACEPILRGRRGKVTYDKNGNEISRVPTEFGKDINLSIDIDLQAEIEDFLADPNFNAHSDTGIGIAVIDVGTGDTLAMVSHPGFDISTIRESYDDLLKAPNEPLKSRVFYTDYPPGSTIKPFIYLIGLMEKKIHTGTVISCPDRPADKGFPNCLRFKRYGLGHDGKWSNIGRNAIRGSCNVYFSHLAHMISSKDLQHWLYRFGFGHKILKVPSDDSYETYTTDGFIQSQGCISERPPQKEVESFDDIKPIPIYERKWFGIGQGNLRTTVLQVANGTAAIARNGIYKDPRLVINENDFLNARQTSLKISKQFIDSVHDGMHAVVYETSGTANTPYKNSVLSKSSRGMTIYGKTGSTERPENAWFSGFVKDNTGRSIAIAVLVEGGKSGAGYAAPIGFEVIRICNEFDYIGRPPKD